jgi:hypothetical protein
LDTPPPESEVPELQADIDTKSYNTGKPEYTQAEAQRMLDAAKQALSSGDMLPRDYEVLVSELKDSLKDTTEPVSTSLPLLERTTPHTSLNAIPYDRLPLDLRDEDYRTYLDGQHEDEYLAILDATAEGLPPPEGYRNLQVANEATLKNPVSVYNWLRKHQPRAFLQDGDELKLEAQESKAGSSAGSTAAASKRENRAKRTSTNEILDEDGNVKSGYQEPPAPKGKRKREDEAYRPKGGTSASASSKRRKKTSTGKSGEVE